ncbi:uncharacterized protein LOC102720606 [Oryza brachyantha]|uniref:F-box domain-containing protein n=1 Tax=Oryza brachyantha TaxID=4533 RepID=J3M5E1_ORYBR|nr:uncharacterized protein LOC102720606 [Oryza brachyantha]
MTTAPVPVSDGGDASNVLFTGLRDHTDLLTEVLLRLPPWSLCQLRCVCKLWRDRTTSSTFLSAYADRHASNPSNWLLLDRTIFIDTAPTPRGPVRALVRISEPPKVSSIVSSSRLCPIRRKELSHKQQPPMVVGYSGGLALLMANDNSYYVCNPFTGDAFLLPAPNPQLRNAESLGIVVARDGEYVVAQLVAACLRCFSSEIGRWEEKPVVCSGFSKSDMAFSSGGMLHFVDLNCGILSCDPFAPVPTVVFISLPVASGRPSHGLDEWIHMRYVGVSAGRLCFLDIDEDDGESGLMSLWALSGSSGEWMLEYKVDFEDLWQDESFDGHSFDDDEVPLVGLVHPLNEHSVYVISDGCLFNIDQRTRQVLDCTAQTNAGREVGSSPPIACVVPPLPHLVSPFPSGLRKEASNSDPQVGESSGKPQKSTKGRRRKPKT